MWVTAMLVVPVALVTQGAQGQPSPLWALISPGGGLVEIGRVGARRIVDICTRRNTIAEIRELCRQTGNCRRLGTWGPNGELLGARYDNLDAKGKRTANSKLIEAEDPFDRAEVAARFGVTSDIHRYGGHPPRIKSAIGEPAFRDPDDDRTDEVPDDSEANAAAINAKSITAPAK